ncbi:MAG TPA: CHASE3 domain-containing protein, partial [Segetibacter sp.]
MRGFIKKRLNTGFVAAIILVLLVGVISFATFQKQSEEAEMVSHTYRVINKLDEIQQTLINMETGSRGFQATNEARFLEAYYKGLGQYPSAVSELENLVQDNPSQSNRLEKVKKDIDKLLQFWQDLGTDAGSYTKQ